MIVAAVVGLVSAPLLPLAPAAAVTVAPLTQIYDQVVNGDYILVGNGSLVCDPNKATLQGTFTCAQLHNGTSATNYVNDFKFMGYVDVDANAATVNSSSATVTVPTGAKVVKAVLYWSGNTGQVRSGTSFLTNRSSAPPWAPQSSRRRHTTASPSRSWPTSRRSTTQPRPMSPPSCLR